MLVGILSLAAWWKKFINFMIGFILMMIVKEILIIFLDGIEFPKLSEVQKSTWDQAISKSELL